eukprot:TRINITY_DN1902_c0_g1_i1.p1 TRINITY_DN1902_c0_g1~~TRINITY_DN1902_c0_g1_i1.p1  ORF type:complete len:426 (-),score=62.58 TRINITY_DN1902_c0_g1_i1:88-1365(-)
MEAGGVVFEDDVEEFVKNVVPLIEVSNKVENKVPHLLYNVSPRHPILQTPCHTIKFPLSEQDKQIAKDMTYSITPESLERSGACWKTSAGMAANQWGILKRIFIFVPDQDYPLTVCYNGEYEGIDSAGNELSFEGCFSAPFEYGVVDRFHSVKATWDDENGQKQTKILDGWRARVFQHETDHTKGFVYNDTRRVGKCCRSLFFANKEEANAWKGDLDDRRVLLSPAVVEPNVPQTKLEPNSTCCCLLFDPKNGDQTNLFELLTPFVALGFNKQNRKQSVEFRFVFTLHKAQKPRHLSDIADQYKNENFQKLISLLKQRQKAQELDKTTKGDIWGKLVEKAFRLLVKTYQLEDCLAEEPVYNDAESAAKDYKVEFVDYPNQEFVVKDLKTLVANNQGSNIRALTVGVWNTKQQSSPTAFFAKLLKK